MLVRLLVLRREIRWRVSGMGLDGMRRTECRPVRDVLCVPQVKKKNMIADYMRGQRSGINDVWLFDMGRVSMMSSWWSDARATSGTEDTRLAVHCCSFMIMADVTARSTEVFDDGDSVWNEVESKKGRLRGVGMGHCFDVSGRESIGAEEAASSMLRLSHTWLQGMGLHGASG